MRTSSTWSVWSELRHIRGAVVVTGESRNMRSLLGSALLVCNLNLACTGSVDAGPAGAPGAGGGGTSNQSGGQGPTAGATAQGGTKGACLESAALPSSTRVARLSHLQYDGAVESLLGLGRRAASEFAPDPPAGGYDNNADALRVVDQAGRDFRRAAEEAAAALVGNAEALARVAPCATPENADCGASFVTRFGSLAFRRPLEAEETSRYLALYGKGQELVAAGSTHARGVHVVVEAMLQSPSFLYRVELNEQPDATGASRLSGDELAAKLSLTLWNSLPDAELREAAASGLSTSEQVSAQATRMLRDERARPVLEDFHRQWLGTDAFSNVSRDQTQFPAFVDGIGTALREESRRFVSSVVFDRGLGIQALLTDTTSFVNADLAKLYGLAGSFDASFKEVELDSTVRAGLLTRAGFLALNAHASTSAPILRGAQILKRILCFEFPPPPAGASTTPLPPFSDEIRTGRDQVTKLTESPACAACHRTSINPMGFAFEAFDAVGQARTLDRGFPLDLSGSFSFGGEEMSFDGAIDASRQIADSESARACYASNWLRFVLARLETADDSCTVRQLADRMREPNYGVKSMLTDLVRSKSFQYRNSEVP